MVVHMLFDHAQDKTKSDMTSFVRMLFFNTYSHKSSQIVDFVQRDVLQAHMLPKYCLKESKIKISFVAILLSQTCQCYKRSDAYT